MKKVSQFLSKFRMFTNIPTMKTGIHTRFGKFVKIRQPGLNFYIPFIQSIHTVSNRLYESQLEMTVRTADKVFPTLTIALQHYVKSQNSVKFYYNFGTPSKQIESYTDNVVRRVASGLTLDQLFQSSTDIVDAILKQVGPKMQQGGFTIQSAQIKNINPPESVLKSMNEINASQRRKVAAKNDGQALKIKTILQAQADAKNKQLRGKGIALMRENITRGWVESILQMSQKSQMSPKQCLEFLIKILHQQTMENMSKHAGTKIIFADSNHQGQKMTESISKQQILKALEAYSPQPN